MSAIKPMSGKLIFTAFAILIFLLGTQFIAGEVAPLSKAVVLLAAAAILAVEVGMKKLMNITSGKNGAERFVSLVSLGLIVSLAAIGLMQFIPYTAPQIFLDAAPLIVILGAIWIEIEAFV